MNKVKKIMQEEFDERMALAVLTYTLGQLGMDNAAAISDEEIGGMEGNAFMTDEFCQAMAKTARRIGKECSFVDDVIPYILDEFSYLKKKGNRRG